MAKGLKSKIMPTVGIAAGAIGSGFVTKFIPVQNDKIKAVAPLVLGFLLMGKKGILGDIGAGMVAGGAIALGQSFGIGAIESPVMDLDEFDTLEVVKEFNIYGKTNMYVIKDTAPSIIPDFYGQFYINTSGTGTIYQAKGISSTSDWKQTSN